ncbi:aminotransferase class I/II-fold pyridoxal phosphate-dependent enzyme [Candidatus Contubernalis alkaliaceticus]|uniref:aminotransferase class I/II-fold pyridoxal phosphate-dependent enzyme n=1 Tax=Candidatus Contubernalis alkaliaceticus TaxID=338645 RepID=UPI001F4C2A2B|nr:aminotransferase class I/II-fold pyridoxal phosphate-dependent enzyme [Candidatus Contubernalis alkalaceticus]UNC90673.1 aminotransferase class I/II-fold pyridoxal phosphate-dependent enzyme [Candidatus Contubernalis alkalaceticus]
MNQKKAPVLEGIFKYILEDYKSFHVPGHQGGKGMDGPLKLLLKQPFKADLTEISGLDNLHAPRSIIKEAMVIAAEAFGAAETFFLVNGSTAGLMAMVNTVCRPGEKIIIPRRMHQGVFGGIITSGADPVYIPEDSNQNRWEFTNVTSSQVKQALEKCPEARAVLLNNPTYFGVCADLKEIRKITAKRGVLLLVDEAHGGHLSFHPDLPCAASEVGADLWVQSTHKTLGSLTQSSMLHAAGEGIDRERLRDMLTIFQSTSPSYLLLASLDAARRQIALRGKELLDKVIFLAEEARKSLKQLDFKLIPRQQGELSLDITKLAFFTDRFVETGKKAAFILRRSGKIQVEMSGQDYILFLLTLGHDDKDWASMLSALGSMRERLTLKRSKTDDCRYNSSLPPMPEKSLLPREAFNLPWENVLLKKAAGRISSQLITLYPPGIPLLVPGEVITTEIIEFIHREKNIHPEIKIDIEEAAALRVIK